MKLFNKQSLILLISVVSINLLCIISVSYAYFTANIVDNDKAEEMVVKSGTMKITYSDTNEISFDNMLPDDYITKEFKVENIGTLDTKYNIKIDVITSDFEDYKDLVYTLTKNGTKKQEEQVLPYEDGYILIDEPISYKGVDNYTLVIKFKKDESNQNDNANKEVEFKIEVDSKDNVELYKYVEPYRDNSGANRPKLYQGLIPIRYENNEMYIADITDTNKPWYDYDKHEWGNAVLINHEDTNIVNKFYNEDGTLKINQKITEDDILQMYVWIPRYKYQLFNADNQSVPKQIINIDFEKGITSTGNATCTINNLGQEDCTNAINGNWYTHPAFTFGETELPGIWVGKFEPSDAEDPIGRNVNQIGEITILPNKTSMVNKSISTAFFAEQKLSEERNKYNLKTGEVDTRVMKNIEWGAVAYLTQSIFGIYSSDGQECMMKDASMNKETCEVWINNSVQGTGPEGPYPYGGTYTGCVANSFSEGPKWNLDNTDGSQLAECDEGNRWNTANGVKASTTGNMYGIYDMSGGAWEYVMGVMVNQTGGGLYITYTGFQSSALPESKYYDMYAFSASNITYERGHLGDSTREILQIFGNIKTVGWNVDCAYVPFVTSEKVYPWFVRGSSYSGNADTGIFAFYPAYGGASPTNLFRSVLSAA